MEIKVVVLTTTQQVLISQIEETPAAVPGEPDCKLTKPFVLTSDGMLESWLMTATRDEEFMISSDKILTLAEPTPTLIEKYEDLIK